MDNNKKKTAELLTEGHTELPKKLHSKSSVDEKQQHEKQAQVSNLKDKYIK